MRHGIGHEDRKTNSPQQTINFNFAGNLHGFGTPFTKAALNDLRTLS
jgi:hypothetical protein